MQEVCVLVMGLSDGEYIPHIYCCSWACKGDNKSSAEATNGLIRYIMRKRKKAWIFSGGQWHSYFFFSLECRRGKCVRIILSPFMIYVYLYVCVCVTREAKTAENHNSACCLAKQDTRNKRYIASDIHPSRLFIMSSVYILHIIHPCKHTCFPPFARRRLRLSVLLTERS